MPAPPWKANLHPQYAVMANTTDGCPGDKTELEQKADQPKRVEGDYGAITQHSLSEQIEFDRYKDNKGIGKKVIKSIYGYRYQPPSARGY